MQFMFLFVDSFWIRAGSSILASVAVVIEGNREDRKQVAIQHRSAALTFAALGIAPAARVWFRSIR